MGIISVDMENRLYWLGRYSERVYTTLRLYFTSFDALIDDIGSTYEGYCKKIDIPDVYGSKEVFLQKYPFDETDDNSIISNLTRAYDNAIVLREEIGSETLSYIQLAIYAMQKARSSSAPLIEIQYVMDDILAFWGIADDSIDSEFTRNIIKTGKRVERIDLYSRLHVDKQEMKREIHRLTPRIAKSGIAYNIDRMELLNKLTEEQELDYQKILTEVENLVQV